MAKLLQFNIDDLKRIFIRRKYKDFLFRRVFREKEDLLDLYNAINGTSYSDPSELEITTLEDAIYMSMKNDKSFIISSTMNLYEHQSTVNPNMPIRGLMYFAKLYDAYIARNKLDIYGRTCISLPTPHYIVFYNGIENIPDKSIMKLSDVFLVGRDADDFPELECKATILNINYGHNVNTLNACKRLSDYSQFIYIVNVELEKGIRKEKAIDNAMNYCIEHDILADILIKHRSEVMGSLLTYYDEKLHMKTLKQEGFEDGYGSGYESGYNEGFSARQAELDAIMAEKNAEVATIMAEKNAIISEFDSIKKEFEEYKLTHK